VTAPEARLGNDIARQFAHLPDEVAVAAIARHIETFWAPPMRDSLRELAAHDPDELDPLLASAAGLLHDKATRTEPAAHP
jgi:formate dehydrogenase subunit delta